MQLLQDIHKAYKAAGGTKDYIPFISLDGGLVNVTLDAEGKVSFTVWDARLTDAFGIAKPSDADLAKAVAAEVAAAKAHQNTPAADDAVFAAAAKARAKGKAIGTQ